MGRERQWTSGDLFLETLAEAAVVRDFHVSDLGFSARGSFREFQCPSIDT